MIGRCKLCLGEKELCKKSHIIPDFMYQDIFDDKHRLLLVQSENGSIQQKGIRQSGEYEGDIYSVTSARTTSSAVSTVMRHWYCTMDTRR